jgi:poly(3-hydroxybutyrate) depolymerase
MRPRSPRSAGGMMRSWVLMRGAHIYPAIATAGGTKMEDEDENEDEDESTARRFLHSL